MSDKEEFRFYYQDLENYTDDFLRQIIMHQKEKIEKLKAEHGKEVSRLYAVFSANNENKELREKIEKLKIRVTHFTRDLIDRKEVLALFDSPQLSVGGDVSGMHLNSKNKPEHEEDPCVEDTGAGVRQSSASSAPSKSRPRSKSA